MSLLKSQTTAPLRNKKTKSCQLCAATHIIYSCIAKSIRTEPACSVREGVIPRIMAGGAKRQGERICGDGRQDGIDIKQ